METLTQINKEENKMNFLTWIKEKKLKPEKRSAPLVVKTKDYYGRILTSKYDFVTKEEFSRIEIMFWYLKKNDASANELFEELSSKPKLKKYLEITKSMPRPIEMLEHLKDNSPINYAKMLNNWRKFDDRVEKEQILKDSRIKF